MLPALRERRRHRASPAASPILRWRWRRSSHHFGWTLDDEERLARGTVVGHLLECAGQLTGGYYADPGRKDVPGMATLGFPFADVDADGNARFARSTGTGGVINRMTATEQLLYEVTDPGALSDARRHGRFFQRRDRRDRGRTPIAVDGARGKPRPDTLKVSVGYRAGYIGEGEISLRGRELRRARASSAARSSRERLRGQFQELRVDIVGLTSLHTRPMSDGDCAALRGAAAGRRPLGRTARWRALHRRGGRGAVDQRAGGRRRRAQVDAASRSASCPASIARDRVKTQVDGVRDMRAQALRSRACARRRQGQHHDPVADRLPAGGFRAAARARHAGGGEAAFRRHHQGRGARATSCRSSARCNSSARMRSPAASRRRLASMRTASR